MTFSHSSPSLSLTPMIPSKTDKDQTLTLDQIHVDDATQPRAEINMDAVEDYAAHMKAGDTFPRLIVFFDGKEYWMADGFHRFAAARVAGYKAFPVTIKRGTKRDALLYGFTANDKHGLRRTRADKHHDVEIMLKDEEWGKWSTHEIAWRCGVSEKLVREIREIYLQTFTKMAPDKRKVERGGKTYEMKLGKLQKVIDSPHPLQAEREEFPEPKPEREPDLTPHYGKLGDAAPDAVVAVDTDAAFDGLVAEERRAAILASKKAREYPVSCPCGCGVWSFKSPPPPSRFIPTARRG